MSPFDVETLRERLQAQAEVKAGRKSVWTPPEPGDFALGGVLAFDQTLTKTGWVLLGNREPYITIEGTHMPGGLGVYAGGRLWPTGDEDLRSFEQTFAKAAAMAEALEEVIFQYPGVEAIVHEMPAVMGYRVESSLMAAREIRRIAASIPFPSFEMPVVMISRQAAYATLTGGSSVEKKHMTAAVDRLIPKINRKTSAWNQDVHDATGLGLKYLYEKKRSQV